MALIYIYDTTELDKQQISDGLKGTDHHWEYVESPISTENIHPESEVISVFVSSNVTREIIEQLPKLRLIVCRSTGYNNIDLAAANEHNIAVANVPTYGESTVAEYTFALLLALTRRLPASLEFIDHQISPESIRGIDLNGKTLGVIGTGHIGQHVIKIGKAFGMRIVAYDPYAASELANELGFEYLKLDDLLRTSDVVSLHAPLTPENKHLINADCLSKMKPSAILVNTARGELIDTQALADALHDKRLAGAALDVLEGEQLLDLDEEVALLRSQAMPNTAAKHSVALMLLNKLPNVILTPHNAFNTDGAIGRINATTCQNIINFWYGEIPNQVKSPAQKMGKLLLLRHAESEWNASGRWSGRRDVHLSKKGFHETALFGQALQDLDITIDQAYCSEQLRTMETLEGALNAAQQFDVPIEVSAAVDERDYGKYTGKNKWDMQELIGEEEFNKMRRGWDYAIPGGETLKMVYERIQPFYVDEVLPKLAVGKNVLIVAHGNSLRALTKYIENIGDQAVETLEMSFGEIVIYNLDADGKMTDKQSKKIDSPPPDA